MRVLIIAHPIVGIDKEKRRVIEQISASISRNKGNVDVAYTMKPGIGTVYSSRAALEGYNAVYAAGGDGTVNDVASGLVGRPVPFGIIPLGTGNGFARSLNIPFETDKLIDMFSKNKTTTIDVGKISSHFFMATAGIGFDAFIAHDFKHKERGSRKLLTYFLIGVRRYFKETTENLVLVADGRELKRRVFGLTIANVPQYGGGAIIAPQASPRSGTLIAVLIPKFNPLRALPLLKRLFDGSVDTVRGLEYIEFKTLRIKRERAGIYHVDGETFQGNPILNVTVIPNALRVIVP